MIKAENPALIAADVHNMFANVAKGGATTFAGDYWMRLPQRVTAKNVIKMQYNAPFANPNNPEPTYNPDTAIKLLEDAGWKRKQGEH